MRCNKVRRTSLRCVATGVLCAFAAWVLLGLPPGGQPQRLTGDPISTTAGPTTVSGKAPAVSLLSSYGRLPLAFEPNRGQTHDRVQFLSRGPGYTLFLARTEAVLALRQPGRNKHSAGARGGRPAVLYMQLAGANPDADISGLERLPSASNYLLGQDPRQWHTAVPTFRRVRYEGIYPGIDVVYYGKQGQLEYDFVVRPGADPQAIRLSFRGAERLEISEQGDLVLQAGAGQLRLLKPRVYQQQGQARKYLEARYVLSARNEVGVQTEAWDGREPLVIDPVLTYSTYLGGSWGDAGLAMAVDAGGSAYVTGETASVDFPADGLQKTAGGNSDVFVARFNPAGSLLYTTYLGGSGNDRGLGIAIDGEGNAYLTGRTDSSDFPTRNPIQPRCSADAGGVCGGDAFVAKLKVDGSALLYSTYLGGSGADQANAISVDSSGNAYVAGATLSGNFPTANPLQPSFGGGISRGDAFISKINAAGTALVYSTYLGGSGDDVAYGLAVDALGNAYVAGSTDSGNFPTPAGLQRYVAGGTDAFVAKVQPDGAALLYATVLGGELNDEARGIAVDSDGNMYIAGNTESANFPTARPWQSACQADPSGNCKDAFVANIAADGASLLYSTYLGGSGDDQANGIAVDAARDIYVTGRTESIDFPTSGAFQPGCARDSSNRCAGDAFVVKLGGGVIAFSSYLGGAGVDAGNGIGVDAFGNILVTGVTGSTDFPAVNPLSGTLSGSSDGFVVKIGDPSPASSDSKKGAGRSRVISCPGGAAQWTGAVDNYWTKPGNWNPSGVPVSGSDVCIGAGYTVVLDSGTQTLNSLNADGTLTITAGTLSLATASVINGAFNLQGGTLTGAGTLTLNSLFTWTGGTMSGAGVTNANSGISLSGGSKYMYARTLNNSGAANFSAGWVYMYDGAIINNQSAGVFTLASDQGFYYGSGTAPQFNNFGSVTRTSSGNSFPFSNVPFNNKTTGTVTAQTGTLDFAGGGTGDGVFTAASGAGLLFSSAYTFNSSSSIGGAGGAAGTVDFRGSPVHINGAYNVTGTTAVSGGTANFNSSATLTSVGALSVSAGTANFVTTHPVSLTALNVSGGTLQGSDNITSSGPFTWTGGTLAGTGQLNAGAGMLLNGISRYLHSRTLNVSGASTWTAGWIYLYDGATINNQAGATFNIQVDTGLSHQSGAQPAFNNAGTLAKSVTPGTNDFTSTVFNNSGTVNVATGILRLAGGGNNTGSFSVSFGALLQVAGGAAHTFTPAASITGASGSVEFSGTTVNFNGTLNIGSTTGGTSVTAGTTNFGSGAVLTSLGPLSISGGTANFVTGSPLTVPSFNHTGGTLTGTDTLNISGQYAWSGGTQAGSGITNAGGGMQISGSAHYLDTRTLNNAGSGTATWTAGWIYLYNGATINNPSGATFAIQTSGDYGFSPQSGAQPKFNNAGTLTKTITSSTTDFNSALFNNTGSVSVSTGNLQLGGGGTSSGSFTVASGATLQFGGTTVLDPASSIGGPSTPAAGGVVFTSGTTNVNGRHNVSGSTSIASGTANFNAGAIITSVGALSVSGGTANFVTGSPLTAATFNLSGGTFTGIDNLTVSGMFTWTGGTMSGNAQTNANGGIGLSGGARYMYSRSLNNAGTATWTAGYLGMYEGATFNNLSGASFLVQCDQPVYSSGAAGTFNNAGTFTKSITNGETTFNSGVAFNNSNTVNVQSGTLSPDGGGTQMGSFTVTANSTVQFGGNHTFSAASSVTGAGAGVFYGSSIGFNGTYNITGGTRITGGTTNFNGTLTSVGPLTVSSGTGNFAAPIGTLGAIAVSGGNLNLSTGKPGGYTVPSLSLSGGYLSGTDTIAVSGALNWTGGTMTGAGQTIANGGITLSGGAHILDGGRTLTNTAAAAWNASYIAIYNGATWNNPSGAIFTVQCDQPIYSSGTPGTFNNAGVFTKSSTGGTTTVNGGVVFNNTGSVQINNGSLALDGGGTSSGTFTVAASSGLSFTGGTHSLTSTTTGISGAGTVGFSGGTTNVNCPYNMAGGTGVSGGVVNFLGSANVTATGTFSMSGGTANFGTGRAIPLPILNFSGGTLTGNDTLNISGLFTWTAGTLSGVGTVNANGGMGLSGSTKGLDGRTLNNAGAASWTGSNYLWMGNGAVLNNLAGASFDVQSDRTAYWSGGSAQPAFNNSGILTRTVTTGTFTFDNVAFNNSATGTVNVQTGTLVLNGGGSGSGSYTVGAVAALHFGAGVHNIGGSVSGAGSVSFYPDTANVGGTYNVTGGTAVNSGSVNFNSSATVTSLGPLTQSGGTLNFATGRSIAATTVNLSGGTLTGPDSFTAGGLFTWSGGWISGSGVTNANGGLAINGSNKYLDGRTLNNAGSAVWTAGYIYMSNGAAFNNLAAGTFEGQVADRSFYWNTGSSQPAFNNAGSFVRTISTAGLTLDGVAFNNTGSLGVQTGTMNLAGGGTGNGSFTVAATASLVFGGGTHVLGGGFSGAGTVNFSAGTITAGGTYNLSGNTLFSGATVSFSNTATVTGLGAVSLSGGAANFTTGRSISMGTLSLSGGNLTGSDAVTAGGLLTWTGGTLSGAAPFNANGGMSISGTTKYMDGRTLNNAGTATWTGSNYIYMSNGAVVNNLATGTLNLQGDRSFYFSAGLQPAFNNAGTISRTINTGTFTFDGVAFSNSGTVSAQTGTLAFSGGYLQTAGATILAGGAISMSGSSLTLQGGVLSGAGAITGSVVNNGGQVSPGTSPGILNITGGYTQTPAGVLNIEIGGVTVGTQFDQLKIGGSATLGGTLNVSLINSFVPAVGNTFPILTFASRTGDFAVSNGLNLGATSFNPSIGSTAYNLIVGSSVNPQPTLTSFSPASALAGGADFVLTVNGTGFVTGSVIRWNGADLAPTTYVNAGQISATVPAANIASAGTASVTVFNPSPGGGLSTNTLTFTVNPPSGVSLSLLPSALFLVPGGASRTINVTVTRSNYTDVVTLALGTLPTGVTANVSQPGNGSSATILFQAAVGAPLISNQPVTLTSSGTGISNVVANFTVSITQAGGAVTSGSGQGAPGGVARIPISVSLNTGVSIDTLSFSVMFTPGTGVPDLAGLSFSPDPGLPAPSVAPGPGANIISVAWLSPINPALAGIRKVGDLVATIPAAALAGQSYAVQVTGASGTLASNGVPLAPGPVTSLTITPTYLVGDVSDNSGDMAGQFGNGLLNNIDLVLALRAVTSVPGFVPASCSDRFDAMDASPEDGATRGGDGWLDNLDLIATLRRVTGADPSQPRRATRGLVCLTGVPGIEAMSLRDEAAPDRAGAVLELGAPDTAEGRPARVPVYLRALREVDFGALSLALGVAAGSDQVAMRFVAGELGAPALADDGLPGNLALAWLGAVQAAAGQRVLLGYAELPPGAEQAAASLHVHGARANDRRSGAPAPIALPGRAPPRLRE